MVLPYEHDNTEAKYKTVSLVTIQRLKLKRQLLAFPRLK